MEYINQNERPWHHDIADTLAEPGSAEGRVQTGREIVTQIMGGIEASIAVVLWDGSVAYGTREAPCRILFREPGALRDLVLRRNPLRIAESYLGGAIDVEGDMERLFALKDALRDLRLPAGTRLRLLYLALTLPASEHRAGGRHRGRGRAVRRNGQASIAHHYDVSNDFYRQWLDPEMVYSCAYFSSGDQSLAEAQRDKLDYLCRKLRLQPGQKLLDIGCGWGALALWAARHYGVEVHGITLSRAQVRLARERVEREGLQRQIDIELRDYRDLDDAPRYDRVVSVGMFEHIGVRNFPRYFATVRRVLKAGGLFLNHGITSDSGWKRTPLTRFMNRYIFPDGELARPAAVIDAMERAGFEILDVEALRRHYVLTLRHWVRALEEKRDRIIRCSSTETWRLWRLYMAGCAFSFDEGSIGVQQILAGHSHQLQPLPLRRDDLYLTGKRGGHA